MDEESWPYTDQGLPGLSEKCGDRDYLGINRIKYGWRVMTPHWSDWPECTQLIKKVAIDII